MKHVISTEQFNTDNLNQLFDSADRMRHYDRGSLEERRWLAARHCGRQIISLFYEPSTRTRLSFELAATKLGMGVVSTENAREFSSAAKGETIEDTIRNLNEYNADALVMRHYETGSAARAAAVSDMPVINAGDGKGEHPTQALLDAYTIKEYFHRLDGLNIVMGGDLRNGRTVRSLSRVLSLYPNNKITYVSTPSFKMGEDIKQHLNDNGTNFRETDRLEDAFHDADVVYWTRLQKERLDGSEDPQDREFVIDNEALKSLNRDHSIIMHPLPRVSEIATEVDNDPRARYFRQAGNGLYVRMALLDHILSNQK